MANTTNILFVDDERAFQRWFKREMRTEKDYRVETASDGEEALEKLESFNADMVIVDLIMPKIDGLALIEALKDQYPEIVILVVSGSVNIDDAIKAMKLGAYDYILKPFETDTVIHSIKDAVKHQQMQRQLTAVRKKVNHLGELVHKAGHVMMLTADAKGRISEFNALASKACGFSKDQLLSKNMDHLFVLNDKPIWKQIVNGVMEKSQWRGEINLVCKNGHHLPVNVAAGKTVGENDQQESIVCFVRDSTLEREMRQIKSELIAVAYHELRTPLTATKSAVDLLVKGKAGAPNEHQANLLSIATRNIERMVGMLDVLNNINEMESGKSEFDFGLVSVETCLHKAIDSVRPSAEEKAIQFDVNIEKNMPSVYANGQKIVEVIILLIGNAVRLMPSNGAITIGAVCVNGSEPGSTSIPMRPGPAVEVAVTISEGGFAELLEDLSFEKLYQAEYNLSSEDRANTVLGLTMCKYLVEAHGSKIRYAKNNNGHGQIGFTLPVAVDLD